MTQKTKTSFSSAYSLGQLSDTVRSFLSRAFSKTRSTAQKSLDTSLDCYDSCAKEIKVQTDKALDFVERNPKQAAVLAAGVGAVLFLIAVAVVEKSKKR